MIGSRVGWGPQLSFGNCNNSCCWSAARWPLWLGCRHWRWRWWQVSPLWQRMAVQDVQREGEGCSSEIGTICAPLWVKRRWEDEEQCQWHFPHVKFLIKVIFVLAFVNCAGVGRFKSPGAGWAVWDWRPPDGYVMLNWLGWGGRAHQPARQIVSRGGGSVLGRTNT